MVIMYLMFLLPKGICFYQVLSRSVANALNLKNDQAPSSTIEFIEKQWHIWHFQYPEQSWGIKIQKQIQRIASLSLWLEIWGEQNKTSAALLMDGWFCLLNPNQGVSQNVLDGLCIRLCIIKHYRPMVFKEDHSWWWQFQNPQISWYQVVKNIFL